MINEINRENMNYPSTKNKRPCLDNLNNRIYELYIRKLGKKRTFQEMDAYNQVNIERGLASLTITKRFKINNNNQFLPVEYKVPIEKFCHKTQSDQKLIHEESQHLPEILIFDIEKEKKMVEAYYSEKNQFLSQLMFGNYQPQDN
jgi:hypothetical protein